MTHLDVAIASRAFVDGRAKRSALFRHRRLVECPMVVVLWQIGAEPFSAAAIAWGDDRRKPHLSVAGEPRSRGLAFAALKKFADWFNPRFEAPGADVDFEDDDDLPEAPQILVANGATIEFLGRLGRRLAYLPLDGPTPADFALVQLGRHLQFLHRHASYPGQQIIMAMTDVLNSHWITPQSSEERQSQAALDAFFIEPVGAPHGYEAACLAERDTIGPAPAAEDDKRVDELMDVFNRKRDSETDPKIVTPLLAPIEAHYRPLVERTWRLVWRCRDREFQHPEAGSVKRRWEEDCRAFKWHLRWCKLSGRRRTRQTPRQAAMEMRRLEGATTRVEAEEACDDPLRMIPYLLDNKAVLGRVVNIDPTHKEVAKVRTVCRPLLTLDSDDECLMPEGKLLWWVDNPAGPAWSVHEVKPRPQGGTRTLLKLTTSRLSNLPPVNSMACFSIHNSHDPYLLLLPREEPCQWIEDEVVTLSRAQVHEAFRCATETSAPSWWLYVVEKSRDGAYNVLPLRNPVAEAGKWLLEGGAWRSLAECSEESHTEGRDA